MNQDISRPHLMGCPTSLWPTSYHSCKGHMKSPAPPLLPMEGGELPVTARLSGFLCRARFLRSTQSLHSPSHHFPSDLRPALAAIAASPVSPCVGSSHPSPQVLSQQVSGRTLCALCAVPARQRQISAGCWEGGAAEAGTPRTWPPLSSLIAFRSPFVHI